VLGLPDWHRAMPQKSFSPIARQDTFTLKKCPPFIDAMTYDFLIPLAVDLKVQDGEFSWDFDVPEGFVSEYSRSPFLRGASVSGPVRRLCLRSGGHPDHGGRCADPASGEARTDRSRRKHHRGNGASRHLLPDKLDDPKRNPRRGFFASSRRGYHGAGALGLRHGEHHRMRKRAAANKEAAALNDG